MAFRKHLVGLHGGVSQQHSMSRLDGQHESQLNMSGSILKGLRQRPTSLLKKYNINDYAGTLSTSYFTEIDNGGNQFLLCISDSSTNPVNIYDTTGTKKTVVYEDANALSYITTGDPSSLRALSTYDTTFILNRGVTVSTVSIVPPARINTAFVIIKSGVASTNFGGTIVDGGHSTTLFTGATGSTETDPDDVATSVYQAINNFGGTARDQTVRATTSGPKVTIFRYHLSKSGGRVYLSQKNSLAIEPNVTTGWASYWSDIGAEATVEAAFGPVLAWSAVLQYYGQQATDQGSLYVTTSDSYGNQMITGLSTYEVDTSGDYFVTLVSKFTDLPSGIITDGTVFKITSENSLDKGYYVKFDTTKNTFVECAAPGHGEYLNTATMPVIMTYSAGTFTVRLADHTDEFTDNGRSSGDRETNPSPSFVGSTINDIFFYKSRLSFLSPTSCVMSRTNDYYDFYAATSTEVLDDDPIDYAIDSDRESSLFAACPFQESVVIFSGKQQFILHSGNTVFTPKSVTVDPSTAYTVNSLLHPIQVGSDVYFSEINGNYLGIREYFVSPGSATNDATLVTQHVPEYIPSDTTKIHASSNLNKILLVRSGSKEIYVYDYLWDGDNRVQSSWHKWETVDTIRGSFLLGNTLYLITQTTGGTISLESIDLTETKISTERFYFYLDKKVRLSSGVHSGGYTSFTYGGYPVSGFSLVDEASGKLVDYTAVGSTITTVGNHSTNVLSLGIAPSSDVVLSEIVIRDDNGVGTPDYDIQVVNAEFSFINTGYFKFSNTPFRRIQIDTEFNAFELGVDTLENVVLKDSQDLSRPFKPLVFAKSKGLTLKISTNSYLPMNITGISFDLDANKI